MKKKGRRGNRQFDVPNKRRIPFQNEDHPGKVFHLVRGFERLYTGRLVKWFQSVPVPVNSRDIRLK